MFGSNYMVTKEIRFQESSGSSTVFPVGTFLQYRRSLDGNITIWLSNSTLERSGYTGRDFDIENYVEEIVNHEQSMGRVSRGSETTKTVHLQIKLLNIEQDVNEFLMNIPRERVVDIKRTSRAANDSRFMVIYVKEE